MPPTNFIPNDVWGSTTPAGSSEELTLPSGQTCLARKMGMEGLLESGILAEADSLTGLVNEKHIRKVRGAKGVADHDEVDGAALMKDPGAFKAIITVADRALPTILVSPKVTLHYTEQTVGKTTVTKALTDKQREKIREESDEPVVFTDQIGLEDKMFLFEWAIGSLGDLASFRRGSSNDVGGVDDGAVVPRKAKRRPRNR